jgi:hypothetical protein
MMRTAGLLILSGLLFLSATGCRTVTGKSLGQHVDDATTTASVKTKLVTQRIKNAVQVGVDTRYGVVYLEGTVPDAETSARAEQIARSAKGVRDVVNQLWIRPNMQASAPAPAPAAAPAAAPQPAALPAVTAPAPAPAPAVSPVPVPVAAPVPAVAMPAAKMERDYYTTHLSTYGQVTGIDRAQGRVMVRTPDGDFNFNMPGPDLTTVSEGDRVQFTLGLRRLR